MTTHRPRVFIAMSSLFTVPDGLAATVLKVGHHGSYTSSAPAFLAAARPQLAVYSAGLCNGYGHPHREPLANLAVIGAVVYGTDLHGTVVIETDGVDVQVMTKYAEPPRLPDSDPHAFVTVTRQAVSTPALFSNFDPFGPDRDCGEFDTHAEAQAFFIAAGGPARDPHRLDGDNDGIACESLP